MFDWVVTAVLSFVAHYGYLAIFCYMALETGSILHFAPSELVVPFAADLLVHDPLTFVLFVVVTTAGSTLGSLFDYYLARRYGLTFLERYGHVVHVSPASVERSGYLFRRFGEWTVFVGRLLPFVRGGIGFPAGLAEMDRRKFVLYTAAGSALFNTVLTSLAYSSPGRPSPFRVGVRLATAEAASLFAHAEHTLGLAVRTVAAHQLVALAYVTAHGDLVVLLVGLVGLVGSITWWQRDWIRHHPERTTRIGLHAIGLLGLAAGVVLAAGAFSSPGPSFDALTWAWDDPRVLLGFGLSKQLALALTSLAIAGGGVVAFGFGRVLSFRFIRGASSRVGDGR